MPSNHLILCYLLLLPVSGPFPMSWLFTSKYWSFSFSISPMNIQVDFLQHGLVMISLQSKEKKESEIAQLCLTLCDSVDCSLTDSSIHGIFQARILECVAISFSRESSWPRDRIWVSYTAGRPFYGLNHQGSPLALPPRYSEVFYTHCIAPQPTCCLRL